MYHNRLALLIAILISVVLSITLCSVFWFIHYSSKSTVMASVGSTVDSEQVDELVLARYSYKGDVYEVTARQVIESERDLDDARNSDGSYSTPTADQALATARNAIMQRIVEDNGVTVSEVEVSAYALATLGTSDIDSLAGIYGMGYSQTRNALTLATSLSKLRNQVVGGNAPTANTVTAPAHPADGEYEVGNAEYASYIIGLLGSHWNSIDGTWADTDNDYYKALANQVFAPGSASYEAALAAYAVAYATSTTSLDAWTSYVNEYLDDASISIATMRA